MEKNKDCKVLITTLIERMWKNKKDDPQVDNPLIKVGEIISFIIGLGKIHRFYNLKDNKFCFLESADLSNPLLITGYFKSARNEFRPDLIDKKTARERKNPKQLSEGDIEKTHFVIKIDKAAGEVYLFLEYNFHGIHANNVINYLNNFQVKYLESTSQKRKSSIHHYIVVRENFLTELRAMSRTRIAEVYFHKQLLGGEALNFSNKTVAMKNEVKLVVSASAQNSIKDAAVDFYNALNRSKSGISKVRVYGKDQDDNAVVLDTSFMEKVEFVNVALNQDTGEVNTTQLFTGMKKIAKDF